MRSLVIIIIISATLCNNNKPCQSGWLLQSKNEYFPSNDSVGGWRTLSDAEKIKELTGIDKSKLDQAFDFIRTTSANGGLLVVRHTKMIQMVVNSIAPVNLTQ